MKPVLRLDTTARDALFSSPYSKRSPVPESAQDDLEDGYPFSGDRSSWRRVRAWVNSKVRGGAGRRYILAGLVGLLWLGLFLYKHHNHPSTAVRRITIIRPSSDVVGRRDIDLSSKALPLEASLKERLEIWRNAPGGRGDLPGEVEPGQFVQWNLEQCGQTIDHNLNTHMIQHSHQLWGSQTRQSIYEHRTELIGYMEDVLARNLTSNYGNGRGIVMVAGNADTLQRVKWTMMMLRKYDCGLPVQVYHFPSEAPADDDPIRQELTDLGAELVAVSGQIRDEGKSKSYHIKATSITDCPWQEVLYLDSDSIPLADPEALFNAPSYKRLGIWATPDYWKTPSNNPMWAIMGVKCRNEWEMESGQMVVDKKRHMDVMLLVRYMMERHDFWFRFSDGDKDIFRFALLALRKRWGVPGRWVSAAGFPRRTQSGDFCANTMLQHDAYGEPMFVHYNLLKQIPSGVRKGFSWGRMKRLPMFDEYPPSPATARLGGRLVDDRRGGGGDVDCDMLADADEYGVARSPAPEEVMRRAVRERGVKVIYHGGVTSALCIDLQYVDPRSSERQAEDRPVIDKINAKKAEKEQKWQSTLEEAKAAGLDEPIKVEEVQREPTYPDWGQSPIQLALWADHPLLRNFEDDIYATGFKPNGKGF